MSATRERQLGDAAASIPSDDGFIDFEPPCLRQDASLREAAQRLLETGAWGIAIVDDCGRYVGTCTFRSIVAGTLPVRIDDGASGERAARAEQSLAVDPRIQATLERPVTQGLDLEVPAIRLSTALPQLLSVLCRRSPIVPIVSDSGMRLLGVASLTHALRALLAGRTMTPGGHPRCC
jgi:CBS domain-containing protein